MKTFLALAATLVTLSSAHAAVPATILEAQRTPGFEMNPQTRTFYVQDDGKMTLEIVEHRNNNKKTVRDLGTLSEYAVRSLLEQVNRINPHAKLVDPKENEPRCTDTPYTSTYAFVKGKRVQLSQKGGCHESALENHEGADLANLAESFLEL